MGLYPGPCADRPEPERGQVRQGCRIGQGHLHVGNRGDPDLRGVRGRRAGSHEHQAAGAGHRHPPMSLAPSRILETIDRICLLGAAVLARGLVLAFGARPLVVAEARFRGPIMATLDALADSAPDSAWRRAVRYAPFPSRRNSATRAAAALWDRVSPVAIIS